MTAPSLSDGRQPPATHAHRPSVPHTYGDPNGSPPPEPLLVTPPIVPYPHTPAAATAREREASLSRGRALSASSPHNASPRAITPASSSQSRSNKQSMDIERKPSVSYSHHRQASIVHGVQHSRNPSLLASASTSPLSPGKIMSALSDGNSFHSPTATIRKSPSMSTLPFNGVSGSAAIAVNRSFESAAVPRGPSRMHSGKVKRSQEHQRSQSRAQVGTGQDLKTVGEYAMHHLFTSFIAEADEKIERCLAKSGEPEPKVENICGPGVDPAFDQLISSLGHINRHKPKALIDTVIFWRRRKADATNVMYTDLKALKETASTPYRIGQNGSYSIPTSPPNGHDIALLEHQCLMADRKSVISIYILCRVLIEVMGQTTLKALNGPDNSLNTAGRLEEVIYSQLQSADPETVANSPVIRANWVIRGQLLGVMSGIRFEEVTDRFVKDLEGAQKRLAVKGAADSKLVAKTALLIRGMRWLKVRFQPEDAWSKSCDMLLLLAKFFTEVHGRTMKHAYAELFEHLLLPIAASATSELNVPRWREVVATVQPRITQMLSKADHWLYVYPLQAVLLCASPPEVFASQWLPLVTSFQLKTRDRVARSHALKAICRLVWRYLNRTTESANAIHRKLTEIVGLVFQGGKRVLISTDPMIADPLIQLIRIIGYQHQDFCFKHIVFPLMNSNLFYNTEKELKIENLDPEKTVIAIRAFLAIMNDLEKLEPPRFPVRFECDALMDPSSRSPITHRRTRSQGFAVSAGRTERLSRPVMITNLNEVTREYYIKFCKILGHLTIICDNTFGGQAVLEEKFSSHTPKTPMAEAFTFNRRDDATNPTDLRQHYYDLLHVAVEALPRCLSPHLPITSLVNLLCTGTAHVQSHIAASSAQSLKSIARQSHAQQVTIGFARFIFTFDDRYATVSDGSLLGPGHIENTLQLYVELLQIWIDDIQQRTRKATANPAEHDEGTRPLPLDLSGVLAHVDEVESHGLFFLCSPSRTVRAIAVTVLRLITKFDIALGKPCTRIISILEGSSQDVIDVNDERLSLAERSRLQKGLRKSNVNSTLVELCSSEFSHDANLWFKVFPNLVRLSAEICLHAVALTRELVCKRLTHAHRIIMALTQETKVSTTSIDHSYSNGRSVPRLPSTSPDVVLEQWKIHLIFACTTLTNIGSNVSNTHLSVSTTGPQHVRKTSKSSAHSQDKIASATELFSKVVPFLSVSHAGVRAAAVAGLGASNSTIYQTLLEALQPPVLQCTQDGKERLQSHQRTASIPRRNKRTDCLRTEITHLLSLTCPLLQDPRITEDSYVMQYLNDYAKHLRIFLSDSEIQGELEFQKLRTHFCALMEGLYECVRKLEKGSPWMSFQSRQATFALMENWCGFSPNETHLRRQHEHVRRSMLEREGDLRTRGVINSAMEKERNELQFAALSAMATLCAGPLRFVAEGRVLQQFDVRRMLSWVHATFEAPSDRTHALGRKALQNLIVHNLDQPYLMAQTMRMCYVAHNAKALASYFEVVTRALTDNTQVTTPFWKILCAGLYTLGNEDSTIRMKSVRLLRTLEERQGKTSKLQDLDISVSDKTTAVYKLAQFETSRRLAMLHPELAFHVFSEFSVYFNELQPDHQRNMVSGMLPWIQAIELQLDPNGGPTATSYMLLVNLFEITVRSSITLHNEIQALWQALATGPYAGNVQLVLDFIIGICLDKKEQNFVAYAKQIVVFLSKTPAGARVVEYLLMQINPKTMVAERRETPRAPVDTFGLPYIADLTEVLPSGAKQNGLSLGQLSMILLVDLVVSPFHLPPAKLPTLLQVILVQWDQHTNIVQDQARELLVHLIHEVVISKIDPDSTEPDKKSIEDFIESIRQNEPKIAWAYGDSEVRDGAEDTRAVPEPMAYVVDEVVKIFSVTYPGIREEWGKVTMDWATSCAVRHVACRSFQVFRCISTTLESKMLQDMLARLSNTIADDENHDCLLFSLEILTTLRSIIEGLDPLSLLQYPQLFWATCACLETIFEREYQEGLSMLSHLLTKMDLSDPAVLKILRESQPQKWEGGFNGVHALIYKGIRSSKSMDRSLQIMEKLVRLPSSDIVGNDDRLLFTVLGNLPRYLESFDSDGDASCRDSVNTLAFAAETKNFVGLARVLDGYAHGKFRTANDFLTQCTGAIRTTFFPVLEYGSLVFLLGMVNNHTSWFKVKTMQILDVIIPDIDMRKPEIASQGPDLISPLLRLLQTEHCQQALGVLDNIMDMTGTPLDNKHLRMSMAGSHSSRATRKEYDTTKSLYGIPEESGWSIPMPAIHSTQTRANVHAVFYTLTVESGNGVEDSSNVTTPEFEFHKEDSYDTYFPDRTTTMLSDSSRMADSSIGGLAEKLDTLDDFFDEPSDPPLLDDLQMPTNTARYAIEERENLYDQQALPILQASATNATTSFQTGFAELRHQAPREQAMNPGAFAQASVGPPTRPGMHNRSVTSPVMAISSPSRLHGEPVSGDETGDERDALSDAEDDRSIARSHTTDEYSTSQATVKPVGGSGGSGGGGGFKALRSGLRRLTSSSGNKEARDQLRAAAAAVKSPQVPKMPATYLRDGAGPFSAEP